MARSSDDPLENLQREVERLFHDLVYRRHPASHFGEPRWSPPADLVVSADAARVILELAGVPRERVRVTLRGRTLEITGRRETPVEPGGAHYHRAEIFFGDFRRALELPWDADPGSIDDSDSERLNHMTTPKFSRATPLPVLNGRRKPV